MNLLQEAYTALLSGLAVREGNEIHWQNENGDPITVEPVDVEQCKYIVRHYYKNGNKRWETEYQNDKLHGKHIGWHKKGNKCWEAEYQSGERHGKSIGWDENGNKRCEIEYQNDKLHGKYINWDENGNKSLEEEYEKGKLIR